MTASRPYLSKTGTQLSELFEAGRHNPQLLRDLSKELKHRTTPSALELRKKVDEALSGGGSDRQSEQRKRREAQPPPPPRPPTSQTIQCRTCQTALRIPVRSERVAYTCPTCKAEFETLFDGGILQVVWTKSKPTAANDTEMSDALAREVLGVEPAADFPAIKAAWRKACQQYHPDKHQGLPERLRRAADVEMQRVNEAYRFLERSTASDF